MTSKEKIAELISHAGLTINGPDPYDPQVHNELLYDRILAGGTLALGEAYMDGWWNAADLPGLFSRAINANVEEKINPLSLVLPVISSKIMNLQSLQRAFQVGERHYDIGNDLYEKMLDARMTYTCGYWKDAKTLDEAQEAKLDLVCRKIGIKRGDRVLDIGCGWGSFAKYAAEKYGASVVGVTVSKEQAALAKERVLGLPIEIRLQDYRGISDAPFDHVVSLGMFEHVGYKNYKTYFTKVRELLKNDGIFILHTIGTNISETITNPWVHRYIFPNGHPPSIRQIGSALEGVFVMEDWHNFGVDYEKTLIEWSKNFEGAWPSLKQKYGERFYRMWCFWLAISIGSFHSRQSQLWQIVLSKNGIPGGYQSVR